jgi:hypothetical protein
MAEAPEVAYRPYSAATKMFALAAVASIWMHNYYFVLFARSGCANPAPACPQRIDNHGAIAYISTSQSVFLDLLMGCFVLFALPAVVASWKYVAYQKRQAS